MVPAPLAFKRLMSCVMRKGLVVAGKTLPELSAILSSTLSPGAIKSRPPASSIAWLIASAASSFFYHGNSDGLTIRLYIASGDCCGEGEY